MRPAGLVLAVSGLVALALTQVAPAQAAAARKLFAAKSKPAAMEPQAIGSYAKGCLAGGVMLPVTGPAWQAMRLSRNRNWGHPRLVTYVERLALASRREDGWPGLLIGDLAQPRGGPMLSGHRSHQIGLDADIWLMPMPEKTLSREQREKVSAQSMIKSPFEIDAKHWKPGHARLLRRAASDPQVARIFVHPAIKKALCESPEAGSWLRKVRPWWGHHYHFHVRLKCPRGSRHCVDQKPPPEGRGCGKELDSWFARFRKAPPKKPKKPAKKPRRRELTLADLPAACREVLKAEDKVASARIRPVPASAPIAAAAAAGRGSAAQLARAPMPQRKPAPPTPVKDQTRPVTALPAKPSAARTQARPPVPLPGHKPAPPAHPHPPSPPVTTAAKRTPAPPRKPAAPLQATTLAPLPTPKPKAAPHTAPPAGARPRQQAGRDASLPWLRGIAVPVAPLPDRRPAR